MRDLVVHPNTSEQLERFAAKPSHALLLVGSKGVGKNLLAVRLAESILDVPDFFSHPYASIVSAEDGKSIGIDEVRKLDHFLSLKVPTKKTYSRVVVIEGADLLTGEAQNALLKTLEEPPAGTVLILTTSNRQMLLPTILSRTQIISVMRPDKASILKHFGANEKTERIYTISGGLPGLMSALLADQDHQLLKATEKARQLLAQSSYERLLSVDELVRQKELAADVAFILQQMAHVSLQSATGQAAKKWQKVLEVAHNAAGNLKTNSQPKLVLTEMMMAL